MSEIVHLKIECIELPDANWGGHSEIWVGIQRGKDVVQAVKLPVETVFFEVELRATVGANGLPNFLGPFANGTTTDRFVYLCWGKWVFGTWVGFRRAKIRLSHLDWRDLESGVLRLQLKCTDAKQAPICATIPAPLVSWQTAG